MISNYYSKIFSQETQASYFHSVHLVVFSSLSEELCIWLILIIHCLWVLCEPTHFDWQMDKFLFPFFVHEIMKMLVVIGANTDRHCIPFKILPIFEEELLMVTSWSSSQLCIHWIVVTSSQCLTNFLTFLSNGFY